MVATDACASTTGKCLLGGKAIPVHHRKTGKPEAQAWEVCEALSHTSAFPSGTVCLEGRNTSSSDLSRTSGKMQRLLLCLAFLLPLKAGTGASEAWHSEKVILLLGEPGRTLPQCLQGTVDPTLNHHLPKPSLLTTATPKKHIVQASLSEDIIGGDEARPHSRPYMALLHFVEEENEGRCGGALVRKEFVLMAAHCRGSSIHMTLGAYNIREQERTQKVLPVTEAIHHPHYNPKNFANGIMLLKLKRKAKLTATVGPLSLPKGTAQVRPGQVCSLADWGAGLNGHFSKHSAGSDADRAEG
uniref:Peptidase S1 domain-containing protein n=1 Tax=Equus caballus TaxID=9796 RepID=A0A9L0RGQ7_HORSE